MKTLNCTLVIIGLIILTITNPLIARFDYWDSENGVKIRQGHHVFWTGTAMITDDNDHWLIAWADARNGTMDVYAQLYDADGNELWTPGGILVANGEYPEEMPILAYAGNGDWIIGWQDYRLDVNYRGEMMLYVQKYNSNGEALWQEGGVFVGPEGGNQIEAKNQTAPLMFSTSDGGVICVYQNSVDRRVQYFGQRLSNDGKMIWDNQGVLLTENANNIKICPDENDGVFISINRYGRDDESDIFINHLDSNGELCWGENTDGISLDNPQGNSNRLEIVPDGNGGVFASWSYNHPRPHSTIYGQHINREGELQWEEFGSALTPRIRDSFYYRVINSNPDEIEIVWAEYNNPVYAQRIESSDQQPVFHWGEQNEEISGLEIYVPEEACYPQSISSDGQGGLVVTWVEHAGRYRDYRIQRVTREGEIPWNEVGNIRVNGIGCSSQKIVVLEDKFFFAWRESKPPESGISFQAYNIEDGSTQFEEYSIPVVSGIMSFTQHPKIVRSGESAYVSWVDARYGPFGEMPYMQRVDIETGQPQWEDQGINLTPTYFEDHDSSNTSIYRSVNLIPDGSGGAIAVWAKRTVVAQRVNEDGSLEWGESGIPVFGQYEFDFNASCTRELFSDNEGGAVVIAELDHQIRIQRLDSNGQPLLGENGIEVHEKRIDRYNLYMKAIELSDGNYLVLWLCDENLEAVKVNMDGESLWESPVVLKEFSGRYSSYKVAEIENTIVVTYDEMQEDVNRTFMIYIDQDGQRMHNRDGLRLHNFDDDNELIDFYSDGNMGWITYLNGRELFISSIGRQDDEPRLDDERTQLISVCENNSVHTKIVGDGIGGVYVFWVENANKADIFYKHYNGDVQPVCEEYENAGVVLVDARYFQAQMCMVPDDEGGVLTAWNDWRSSTGHQEGDDVYIMRVDDGYSLNVKRNDYSANAGMPGQWLLAAAYPNPFNSTTKISFRSPVRASIKVAVFDVLGREVAALSQGVLAAGEHTLVWNSHDSFGQPVVSGMYFYKLEGEGVQLTKKMFLIR